MDVKKILFFKPGAIGDFLHSLPALHALKKRFPQAHITAVISKGQEILIQGTTIADRIEIYDKALFKGRLNHFLQFGLHLRREKYDLFVDMQASVRSLILRRFSGADRVLVYRKQKAVLPGERRLHAVENFMATLAPLGINGTVERIELPVHPEAAEAVNRFLAERGIGDHQSLIALNCSVGAARPARNWVPERFGLLADRLMNELGAAVVFIGGAEDRELVAKITTAMHNKAVYAAGEFSLAQSAALLARCACLVSSDTGPLHIATSVQTPVVGLYGSTDALRTGPVGEGHIVLKKKLSCIPCEEKECPLGTRGCMTAVTVDDVFNAVRKVIQQR